LRKNIRFKILEAFYTLGKEASIYSIKSRTHESTLEVHKEVHELLTEGVLVMKYSSRCPICESENISDCEDKAVKCRFCNEMYRPQFIEEKFRISKEYDKTLLSE
jgi:hypothetical protein